MPSADAPPPRGERRASLGVHVSLFLVQIIFSSLAVEGKVAMGPDHGVSPPALAMSRILGGAVVFIAAHLAFRTPRVARFKDGLHLASLALFGVVLNQALFLAGLRKTSPMSATLLAAMIPVTTALLAALTGRERLTGRAAAGIAVALFGVLALSGFALPQRGDVLVLLNSLSFAIYVVSAKSALDRFGAVTVVAWVFGCGALLFAPLGATALLREAPGWSSSTVGLVAFIVLVPTILGYGINAWALRRAAPTVATIYVYVQPFFVALLSWLQLGHGIELRAVLAGGLIFAGVGLVATAPRRSESYPLPAPSTPQ